MFQEEFHDLLANREILPSFGRGSEASQIELPPLPPNFPCTNSVPLIVLDHDAALDERSRGPGHSHATAATAATAVEACKFRSSDSLPASSPSPSASSSSSSMDLLSDVATPRDLDISVDVDLGSPSSLLSSSLSSTTASTSTSTASSSSSSSSTSSLWTLSSFDGLDLRSLLNAQRLEELLLSKIPSQQQQHQQSSIQMKKGRKRVEMPWPTGRRTRTRNPDALRKRAINKDAALRYRRKQEHRMCMIDVGMTLLQELIAKQKMAMARSPIFIN